MTTDCELLRDYAERKDEAAFAEVVRRQTNFVYSVALRVSRNAQIAEDVTQAVFTTLARDAGKLCRYDTIIGWLHTTARRRAIDAIRGEVRRRARELEALTMQNDPTTPGADWAEIAPALDEAVQQLNEQDRRAILLRYFNGLSHQEIGAVLGLSENSANKRVERALEKLRGHFTHRGITTTAAILAATIGANSVQAAPVGLVEKSIHVSMAGTGGSLLPALFIMSNKTKIALVALILLALVATITLTMSSPSAPSVTPAPALASTPAPTPTTRPSIQRPPAIPPAAPVAPIVAQVAMPTVKPAAPVEAVSAPASTASSDPRVEITSAMTDFVSLLESGDYVTAADHYLQLPPSISGQQVIESMQQNPDFPNTVRMMMEATRAAETVLPTYNDTGDLATYKLSPPVEGKTMVRWKKVDGLWRVDAFEGMNASIYDVKYKARLEPY